MLYRKLKFLVVCLVLFSVFGIIQNAESCHCDDEGAWAELLVSPPSNSSSYILGGLFGIHGASLNFEDDDKTIIDLKCDCTYQETVFLVEAMIYAIDEINKNGELLPDIELGYNILGSCDTASENAYFALEEYSLLEMQFSNISDLENEEVGDDFKEVPVASIIGPCTSDGGTQVATLLHPYGIPVISFGATVTDISKRSRFPTFFRAVFG